MLWVLLGGLVATAHAQVQPADPNDLVAINGTAYWAAPPTGPDFEGVRLIPFQADNPTQAAWLATQAQNQRHLDPASLPQNIQVSHSGLVPGASHPVGGFSEAMVSIDPTDSDHLLGTSRFFYDPANYGFYSGVFESYDAGLTWSELQPEGIEAYSLASDPVTAFDDLGNGYLALLTRGPAGLEMLRIQAGSFRGLPVVVNRSAYPDKPWMTADQNPQATSQYAGNLYMSWTSFGGPVTAVMFSRSTNRNQTWSSPISVARGDVQGSVPATAPDGSVYVVYARGIFHGGVGTLQMVRSTNGGASFGGPLVAAKITAIPYTLPNSWFRTPGSLPAFAVSPKNGNLYLAWSDYRHGDADIYFTRSTNRGASWSTPVRLNDDPISNGMDQF
jgi:hypothetical protein